MHGPGEHEKTSLDGHHPSALPDFGAHQRTLNTADLAPDEVVKRNGFDPIIPPVHKTVLSH